ncbi:hypothetical protein LOC67_18425 [Stieleria sp. JC731]|uniref:hypothetical protein n=1 Tax=Pirellulaceae TaxID=2691357 RepID=UPI001E4F922E|nr:hypothetical protein [Stieleria sp. JC731]MCC9602531.1 hypothetical protein [Stieleria sp. JC731]
MALFVFAAIGLDDTQCAAQLPSLGLKSLSQSFFAPGETYKIHIADSVHGQEIDELHFSHPGINAQVLRQNEGPDAEPVYNHFRISVDPSVPDGRYEVRAGGRFGISNPRSIIVDHRVKVLGKDPPSKVNPLQVETGQIYATQVQPAKRSYVTFRTAAGTPYRLQLIANAIDSQLIGRVSIIDHDGRIIESRFGSDQTDSIVTFASQFDSDVTIVFGDALYRGGNGFECGLLIEPASEQQAEYLNQLRTPKSITSRSDEVPVAEPGTTKPHTVPFQVEGYFDTSDQRESFLVDLAKGHPVFIEVVSDQIAQPTDVRLIVKQSVDSGNGDIQWKPIATADDSANIGDSVVRLTSKDPRLRFDAPADGTYQIVVWDQDNGGALGNQQSYRLIVRPELDDFDLLAYHVLPSKDLNLSEASGIYLPRGASETIRVFATRRGRAMPIKVDVDGLPEGVTCRSGWIAANQTHVDLTISAAIDAPPNQLVLDIHGQCQFGDQSVSCRAKAASVIWGTDAFRSKPIVRLCENLRMVVSDMDRCPLTLQTKTAEPIKVKKGDKAEATVTVQRVEGNKSSLVLRAKHSPPGVKVPDLTIAADKSEGQWKIEVTDKAIPGTYTFWGQAESKVKFATNPQALDRAKAEVETLKKQLETTSEAEARTALEKVIQQAEQRVQTVAKQAAAKDITLYLPSPLITVVVE